MIGVGGQQCLEPILIEEWIRVSQEGTKVGPIFAQAIERLCLRRRILVGRCTYVIQIERCVAAP
jgi:hypothetical protein